MTDLPKNTNSKKCNNDKTTIYKQKTKLDFHQRRKDQNPPSLLPFLSDTLWRHVTVCQLSREGEIQPKQLQGIIGAPIANTHLQASLTTNYIYKKFVEKFPESEQQTKVMKVEDG